VGDGAYGNLCPIYTSTNSGATWTSHSVIDYVYWSSVASSADGTKLAAATFDQGRIYVSTNSGSTWNNAGAPSQKWNAVASSADGTRLVAAAYNDGIYTNTGAGWNECGAPIAPWYSVASSSDGTKLVAGGQGGPIFVSTDSGATWTSNSVPGYVPGYVFWISIASSADGTRLIAENGHPLIGPIYTSTNSGISWISNSVSGEFWEGAASSADGNKLVAVVFGGGIYTSYSIPTPQLNLMTSSNNLALSWLVPSTNFVLQQNSDLATANWVTLTNTPVLNFSNLQDEIVLSPTNGSGFFRLISQ
jgi:photosystem II stability/assembly factor-like uncharacterized protein